MWAARIAYAPCVATTHERFELPDGDFVDLAWIGESHRDQPLVIILHGLEGSLSSPYVQRLLQGIEAQQWTGCLMHFRGCGGELNRLPRTYHSGDTDDFKILLATLRERYAQRMIAACGYSLGGNVLLKFLGESGAADELAAAAAVSVPFDLAAAAERLNRGFSRIYQAHLLSSMKSKQRRKFVQGGAPFDLNKLSQWNSFREYDEHVTAPLHGFAGADDYYARASSIYFLNDIQTPTLIVHAQDDPFLPAQAIPSPAQLPRSIKMDLVERGGHVGFVTATSGWLEQRILEFMTEVFTIRGA